MLLREAGDLDGLRSYLEAEYDALYAKLVEELKEAYPAFWDAEREAFVGRVSTNAIQSGNWRLMYGLRTSYDRYKVIRGRTALLALRDSRQVFAYGRPMETFAHRHSSAGFARILGEEPIPSTEALPRPPPISMSTSSTGVA